MYILAFTLFDVQLLFLPHDSADLLQLESTSLRMWCASYNFLTSAKKKNHMT